MCKITIVKHRSKSFLKHLRKNYKGKEMTPILQGRKKKYWYFGWWENPGANVKPQFKSLEELYFEDADG